MKFELKDQNVLFHQDKECTSEFLESFNAHYAEFQSYNIIFLAAESQASTPVFLDTLIKLIKAHQHHKKSFVVVSAHWISNELPEELVCVPTLQEAIDLIEMDEMQRDLGF